MNTLRGGRGMDAETVFLFVKDTFTEHHHFELEPRHLTDVVTEAAGPSGFSCGKTPNHKMFFDKTRPFTKTWIHTVFNYGAEWSFWHDVSEISKFSRDSYVSNGRYNNDMNEDKTTFSSHEIPTFETWWNMLGAPKLDKVMPVCYSGFFAVRARNMVDVAPALLRMQTMLERGNNIIEGHYAERSFAALFLPRLPSNVTDQILCLSNGVRHCEYTRGYCGTLYGCRNEC
mmetsp:Transcript_1893/g.7877  ORF Transcript_1893/g.7877 Transcript_1893/m.7877 type:complete len:229 (-) Transcript_1893:695-1381(-)